MSGITVRRSGKFTLGTFVASAFTVLVTGFFFAAGYDIYARLFKKQA
jgi:hypothetical protein